MRIETNTDNTTSHVALVDRKLFFYDTCGKDQHSQHVSMDTFTYIGQGLIYSIDGIEQKDSTMYHFWRYRERTAIGPKWVGEVTPCA